MKRESIKSIVEQLIAQAYECGYAATQSTDAEISRHKVEMRYFTERALLKIYRLMKKARRQ